MTSQRVEFRGPLSPDRYQRWTTFALWSLTIIVVSGGAVRLTASGLGCSDWPNCQQDQLVADLEFHAIIEFVNRLFTGVVTVAVIMAVLGSLRLVPRRRDLVWLSWGLVAGVVAQIVLGGLLVKTDLDPRFTMGHFLLSMVLLWDAVVLQHRAGPGGRRFDPPGHRPMPGDHDEITPTLRRLRSMTTSVFVIGAALLVTGTIVTGSGPHSGSTNPEVASRLPFLVRDVTRIHSLTAALTLVVVVTIGRTAHRLHNDAMERHATQVGVLLVIQGSLGYLQYFTGVPVLLVGIHITLASLTWIAIVRLRLTSESVTTKPSPIAPGQRLTGIHQS